MKLSTSRWSNTNGDMDGLLFFSQRLDEMLFDYTIDLYKVPVLNTHLLLREYISVLNQVEISNRYLPIILAEITSSLAKDPVVKKYWGNDNVVKSLDALKILPDKAKAAMIEYLNHAFGDTRYLEWCCEYIKWIVTQNNQKEKIEQALKCFLPELIRKGYSSQYIYYFNRKCILQSDSPSIEAFIDRFDCQKRKYKVYIAAEKWITTFEALLSQRMDICFNDDGNYKKYKHDADRVVIHIDDIEALDDNQAAQIAFERINLFLRFYTAVDNKDQPKFQNIAMVIENTAPTTPAFVSFAANEYSVIEGMHVDEASKYTESLITDLITHARCALERLAKAVDLHNNSLRSPDYSSGFLNLWSALEVLSLKNIGSNDLEQVTGTLLPILQNKYFQSTVKDFMLKIKAALSIDEYRKLLADITDGEAEIDKMARFLFLKKFDSLRKDYAKMLTKFPVLRYRMHYLSEAAKEKKSLLSLSERYKERVEWHLSRIYRTRNSLVHSGSVPWSIRYLGEHLHFYVDLLMIESFEKLSCGVQFCELDNALLDSLLACEILKKQLNQKGELSEEDIITLIHPIFTKQDKFEYTCDCES